MSISRVNHFDNQINKVFPSDTIVILKRPLQTRIYLKDMFLRVHTSIVIIYKQSDIVRIDSLKWLIQWTTELIQ